MMRIVGAVLALSLLAGCGDDDDGGGDGGAGEGGTRSEGGAADACIPSDELDVLFVIDNSGGIAVKLARLPAAFDAFLARLGALPGGLPSLHIGVVSSDMGSGTFNISGCGSTGGDKGILHNTATVAGCSPPTDRYISDVPGAAGRAKNYSGTLAAAFDCISHLGDRGCGFEQPLESMKRALDGSNPENAGFLRPNAYLAIVMVQEEDDCSAKPGGALYDPGATAAMQLGPLTSFRCFEHASVCNPDMPRTVGAKQQCTSRENSAYAEPVQKYIDFLIQRKGMQRVGVFNIIGETTPVNVVDVGGRISLGPSCGTLMDGAQPGIRLDQFARAFGHRSFTSICSTDFAPALDSAGQQLAALIVQCR